LRHHHTKNMNIYNSGYTRWGQRMFWSVDQCYGRKQPK
jgi:hypothetical protein